MRASLTKTMLINVPLFQKKQKNKKRTDGSDLLDWNYQPWAKHIKIVISKQLQKFGHVDEHCKYFMFNLESSHTLVLHLRFVCLRFWLRLGMQLWLSATSRVS